MEKKLPGVFAGKIEKKLTNNDQVYYSAKEQKKEEEVRVAKPSSAPKIEKNINQKISEIFNSPNYVYKAEVDIILKDGTIHKKLVGRNGNQLITLDNELISISDIVDIHYSN